MAKSATRSNKAASSRGKAGSVMSVGGVTFNVTRDVTPEEMQQVEALGRTLDGMRRDGQGLNLSDPNRRELMMAMNRVKNEIDLILTMGSEYL